MKILIADDNERVRAFIKKLICRSFAFEKIIESDDGETAVQAFENEKPDIILMDIMMPGIGGLSAVKIITKMSESAKVIVISQLPENEYKTESLNSGAIDFLNKEELNQLPDKLKKIVSGEKTRTDPLV